MDVEQFIAGNVNMARGGYRPNEVAELIRQAWNAGKAEMGNHVSAQLRDVHEFAQREIAEMDRGLPKDWYRT
jgi:hypothetical protein